MRIASLLSAGLLGLSMGMASPAIAAEVTPLVDVQWLKANGERDDVVLLDIRNDIDGGSEKLYEQGHIPGSVYSDYLKAGWRTEVDGVIAQAPSETEAVWGSRERRATSSPLPRPVKTSQTTSCDTSPTPRDKAWPPTSTPTATTHSWDSPAGQTGFHKVAS